MSDRPGGREDGGSTTAIQLAERVCRGFKAHDDEDREGAIEAFLSVDRCQFADLDDEAARRAAQAYVNALWEKDRIEDACLDETGALDVDAIERADWTPVERALRKRVSAVGMDGPYAEATTTAWRRHKTGGDYWTPTLRAQACELRAALGDPAYPRKPSGGQAGYGPEATRYVLAVELHDMHTPAHWEQAVSVMTPYFERILRSTIE